MLNKGILIFALGHPQYGRYAYNLAVTIKAVQPDAHITVISDQSGISHLSPEQADVFNILILQTITANCNAKLWAYKLSPYQCTLVLDADMLWLPAKTADQLFAELEGTPFTAICEGNTEQPSGQYFFWADVEEIREKYKVSTIHQWRTEVMYFEKGETAEAVFKDAIKINATHGLKSVKEFAGGVADELSINIATALHNVEPKDASFKPSYWPQMHGNTIPSAPGFYNNYYLLSVGGNMQTENVKAFYNRIMQAQAPKIGHTHAFPLMSKHSFLPERRKS